MAQEHLDSTSFSTDVREFLALLHKHGVKSLTSVPWAAQRIWMTYGSWSAPGEGGAEGDSIALPGLWILRWRNGLSCRAAMTPAAKQGREL